MAVATVGAVFRGRGRHDAVEHGRGAGDLGGNVAAEIAVSNLGQARKHSVHGAAVRWEIVASEHREGRHARGAAAGKRLEKKARSGARLVRRLDGVADIGMRLIEPAGRRIVAIALFRHRERDDAHVRIAHRAQQLLGIFRRHQHLA